MQITDIRMIENQTLSLSEIERIAYIRGLPWAGYIAEVEDCENQIDGFDALLDQARKEGYEAGREAGLGLDATQIIANLQTELKDVKASHQRCRCYVRRNSGRITPRASRYLLEPSAKRCLM